MDVKYLYHYYDERTGPFLSLSRLSIEDAAAVQREFKKEDATFAAKRGEDYVKRRRELEELAYREFLKKGGKPRSRYPQYMVVEECPWLETWYVSPRQLRIPMAALNPKEISYSYGDLFPTFSEAPGEKKEYWKKIYSWDEMRTLIDKYGLPQTWNGDGKYGPERYIEAQVWAPREEILRKVERR